MQGAGALLQYIDIGKLTTLILLQGSPPSVSSTRPDYYVRGQRDAGGYAACLSTITAFNPPNAKALESAARTDLLRAVLGT